MNIESGYFAQDGREKAFKAREGMLNGQDGKSSVRTEKRQERPETALKSEGMK